MIYITGDTHGEVSRFTDFYQDYHPGKDDYLIIAGDFGCIFGLGSRDEEKLNRLADLPYTILFLDGNHECFPRIYEYPVEEWNGGRVHRIRENILHLMRGQIFDIEGMTCLSIIGWFSLDMELVWKKVNPVWILVEILIYQILKIIASIITARSIQTSMMVIWKSAFLIRAPIGRWPDTERGLK